MPNTVCIYQRTRGEGVCLWITSMAGGSSPGELNSSSYGARGIGILPLSSNSTQNGPQEVSRSFIQSWPRVVSRSSALTEPLWVGRGKGRWGVGGYGWYVAWSVSVLSVAICGGGVCVGGWVSRCAGESVGRGVTACVCVVFLTQISTRTSTQVSRAELVILNYAIIKIAISRTTFHLS